MARPRAYPLVRGFFAPMWRRAFDVRVHGADRIPAGPAVLAANHASIVDHFAMACVTKRYMANLAHREAFDGPLGIFLRAVGCISVARTGGDNPALDEAGETLQRGHLVCLYPEGDWSPDGRLYRFHTGAARMAQRAGVPLVPVAITGTLALRKGIGFRMGGPVDVYIGHPLVATDDARATTHALRDAVRHMGSFEPADEYVQHRG